MNKTTLFIDGKEIPIDNFCFSTDMATDEPEFTTTIECSGKVSFNIEFNDKAQRAVNKMIKQFNNTDFKTAYEQLSQVGKKVIDSMHNLSRVQQQPYYRQAEQHGKYRL